MCTTHVKYSCARSRFPIVFADDDVDVDVPRPRENLERESEPRGRVTSPSERPARGGNIATFDEVRLKPEDNPRAATTRA